MMNFSEVFRILGMDEKAGHPITVEEYEQITGSYERPKYGYVYVATHPDMPGVKIGASANPSGRLSNANVFDPKKSFSVFGCVEVDDYFDVEAQVHEMLSTYQLRGEWFAVTPEKAMDAIRLCVFAKRSR